MTGSVAILAEATHSASMLVASIVAALGARGGSGDGGALEGGLVVAAAGVIVFAALRRLGDPVDALGPGIAGMAACSLVAGLVARYVGRRAEEASSRALQGDAASLRATSVTSGLVAGALALVALTGLDGLDALAALGIAGVVARGGVDLVRSVRPGDEGLDAAEIAAVARVLADGPPAVIGYRRLRARTAGGVRRIDVDVTVRRDATPPRSTRAADDRRRPRERLPDARIVVHVVRPTPASGGPGRVAYHEQRVVLAQQACVAARLRCGGIARPARRGPRGGSDRRLLLSRGAAGRVAPAHRLVVGPIQGAHY